MMSIERADPRGILLTPTSYLVLGLLEREGPSTPYKLKRHVAATIGHLWSFPHALLYKEPARLAALGLLTEEREQVGRRRRLFTITPAGREALRTWLGSPAHHSTELRDLALLQLLFSDLGSTAATLAIADAQLALHQRRLVGYEAEVRQAGHDGRPTVERWRGVAARMGLLYEGAAVEFWGGVIDDVRASDGADPGRRSRQPASSPDRGGLSAPDARRGSRSLLPRHAVAAALPVEEVPPRPTP